MSDNQSRSPEEPLKSYRVILKQEIHQAEAELERPARGLFISGLMAGFSIGFSFLAITAFVTLTESVLAPPVSAVIAANLYAIGFVVVILGRLDLFTEYTTIAILPVLTGQSPVRQLMRLWTLIYLSNLLGCLIFALLMSSLAVSFHSLDVEVVGRLSHSLVEVTARDMVLSAFLAGWLMGLLSWLVTAARDTTSQVLFIWLVAVTIGLPHLHHVITGSVEVLTGTFAGSGPGFGHFGRFLLWTTLGNSLGGIAFAYAIRYSLRFEGIKD